MVYQIVQIGNWWLKRCIIIGLNGTPSLLCPPPKHQMKHCLDWEKKNTPQCPWSLLGKKACGLDCVGNQKWKLDFFLLLLILSPPPHDPWSLTSCPANCGQSYLGHIYIYSNFPLSLHWLYGPEIGLGNVLSRNIMWNQSATGVGNMA